MGLEIQVCHFPSDTRKRDKIEHHMFCHITYNWRGRLLLARQKAVNPIGCATTAQGLRVKAALDGNANEAGIKVNDAELATIAIERDEFQSEWNYCISPALPEARVTVQVVSV
jgi:hypothetical protein